MDFVMALSPLGFVLVGILFLKKGAMKVAPLTLLYTVIIAFSYFNINGLDFKSLVAGTDALLWKGVKEGAKIVMLVFSSFLLLNLMQRTGAIRQVQKTLASDARQEGTACHSRHDGADIFGGSSRSRFPCCNRRTFFGRAWV